MKNFPIPVFVVLIFTMICISTGLQAQTVIWEEDFNDENNGETTGDDDNNPPGPDWTTSYGGSGNFEVRGNEFRAEKTETEGVWTSEVIDISGYEYVELSLDAQGQGDIDGYYKLDPAGPEIPFYENGIYTQNIISGSQVQLIFKITNNWHLELRPPFLFNDVLTLDNIRVTESNSPYPTLYAIDNGEWHYEHWFWGNTIWSYDDYSGNQSSCYCLPDATTNVVIGESYDVEIDANGAAWDVTIQDNGSSLEFTDYNIILDIGNDLNITGSSQLQLHSGNEIALAGNWNNTTGSGNSFDEGNSKVTFDGNIQTIINTSGNETFHDLEVNNNSLVLNTTVTIDNSMTFTNGIVSSSLTNLLVFEHNSASTFPSLNSYVNGPVSKIGDDDFTFPVGKSGIVAPIAVLNLNNASSSTQFTAEYFAAPAPNPDNLPTFGLSHVSAIEYWELERISGDNAAAQVALSTTDYSRSDIYDGTGEDVVVSHYNGGTNEWERYDVAGWATIDIFHYVLTSNRVTSFSPFTFGSSGGISPLPVTLVTFNGESTLGGNRLYWQTTSETDNDYFAVERSKDGETWETLGEVKGHGNSSEARGYSYLDGSPFYGSAFYRLKQVDFNGRFEYSKIISLQNIQMPEPGIERLYPNPAKSGVTIEYVPSGEGELVLFVTNQQGIAQFRKQYRVEGRRAEIQLDLTGLSPGLYFLILQQNDTRMVEKIIKE